MPFGWMSWFTPRNDLIEKAERRLANRPYRGKRTKVKAARKAARR